MAVLLVITLRFVHTFLMLTIMYTFNVHVADRYVSQVALPVMCISDIHTTDKIPTFCAILCECTSTFPYCKYTMYVIPP